MTAARLRRSMPRRRSAVGAVLVAAALVLAALPASAFWRVYPVVGADLMLGQHFFRGEPSSMGGNLDVRVIPAVKLTEDFVVLPSFDFSYQGTKDVSELAGGAQLFQDSMKAALTVRPIMRYGRLKLKPYVGYRMDWLRETTDESLGNGLFDYTKTAAGAEAEWILTPQKWISVGADLYQLRFPNYNSLESSAAAGLGRQNSAAKTLDSNNKTLSASWNTDTPFPRTRFAMTGTWLTRDFPDQAVVDASGQLASAARQDKAVTFGGVLYWAKAWNKLTADVSFNVTRTALTSNQNNYDARAARFLSDFYGYDEMTYRPSLELTLKGRGSFNLAYTLSKRDYSARPVQDADGAYQDGAVWIQSKTVSVGVAVPVGGGVRALAQTHLTRSDSNQGYEKVFAYRYNISSHLFGLSYEF